MQGYFVTLERKGKRPSTH